jgi:hypothetical protein
MALHVRPLAGSSSDNGRRRSAARSPRRSGRNLVEQSAGLPIHCFDKMSSERPAVETRQPLGVSVVCTFMMVLHCVESARRQGATMTTRL